MMKRQSLELHSVARTAQACVTPREPVILVCGLLRFQSQELTYRLPVNKSVAHARGAVVRHAKVSLKHALRQMHETRGKLPKN
jgi:hypothetical protein